MPKPASNGPDPRTVLAEHGGVGSDRQIAEHMQNMPTTDREPVDRRDNRFRHVTDDPMQRIHFEQTGFGRTVVAGLGPLLLVPSGTKRLLAGAGQADHSDV